MSRLRPPPLVVDTLLALVLTVAALGIVDSGRPATVSSGGPALTWSVNPPPRDARPGAVWNAQLVVFEGSEPRALPGRALPLLTAQNETTGEWTTTQARPDGRPGFYRARIVLDEGGDYLYSVLLDDEATAPFDEAPPGMPAPLVLLTLLATLPIALRRRLPIPVLAVTLAAALAAHLAYDGFPFPGPLVALYSVGAHVGRPASLYAAGAAAAALPLLLLGPAGVGFWVAITAVFAAAWLLGDNLRTRRERNARLEAERQANVQRTAAEEQARMARELHDIIGHSVSVMTIQAAAAGDAFDSRPAQVREALRAIESTGRETLAELRRLLAGVRPDESGSFAPAPGLEGLDALAERVRGAGLAVELSMERGPEPLPPSIDLSAYRIVQEALTNTLKHAHATTARVEVRQTGDTLEIDVVDDGKGAETVTPGHGIVGMRERAALFGGHLTAGPAPGGGFAVRARIPVAEPVP